MTGTTQCPHPNEMIGDDFEDLPIIYSKCFKCGKRVEKIGKIWK